MTTVRRVGHYEIRELLGEGGIGQVHAAHDTMLDREVAIKSLRPELVNDKSFIDRFRSEANNLAKLTHPNITTLYSLLPEGGNLYMVMELVRGRTLEAVLKEKGEPFSTAEALAIVGQAADGLSFAHSMGIVHRDIKPANLMITDSGMLKIMDFGIARVQGSQRMTRAGSAFGTPEYMSPEQVKGQDVDARSDLYSLAIVLYEMLTGHVPFQANTDYELGQLHINAVPERPSRRISGLDPVVEKALMCALAKNASDRQDSVVAFKAALGATAPTSDAANIVRKATRFVGTFPTALSASPAMASVSSAVSSVTSAVGESVDKSAIPFALKGVAIGAGAALVVAAAIVLLWRPSSPVPAVEAKSPPAAQPSKAVISTTQPANAPCGVMQDAMFYKPCPPGATAASPSVQPVTGAPPIKTPPPTVPTGGSAKKSPFDATPEPSVGRSGAQPVTPNEPPRSAPSSPTPAVVAVLAPPAAPTAPARPPASSVSTPPPTESAARQPPSSGTTTPDGQPANRDPAADPGSAPPPDAPPANPSADTPPAGPVAAAGQQTAESTRPPARPGAEARRGSESDLVAAYQQKNFGAALELAEPLAREGCLECQFILARLLETGSAGKKDPATAADWYRKAADGGLAKARYNLGGMYLTGNGVLKDARTAAEWFHKAAMQGHAGAQFNLGLMYEKGDGLNRDIAEAIRWYGEAAKSDNAELADEAKDAVERLERRGRRRR